ncbi:hypothetical protein PHYSODRAFT_334931 [Phytophthora sojae]|uniref:Uncharacterized protein n=1 Tax=Phytophthora sojae (strain P6497) TaxID=1094619 RepID=G4ZTH1_PHYSP|nr:hypothetical protein PHYSODRAFT_334931 [Phytophthora sojae]EGZ13149.1 hypothetical protein PHYSODRAFT_334931 [Phytophthora sojae]|eukprot:XP_009530578.1 hypothetical protein PHYSODRAFT_334931 [Phytophthora sojae]
MSAKKRGFSPDFSDSGVTAWGISPDTPDAFGLAIVDAAGSSSGGGPRFLSLSGSADAGGASSDGQSDDLDADGADMLLPFAIGERSSIGSSGTTAADSVSTGAGSALNRSSGASLDTASVGSFLHQIKNAPRLSKSASALTPSAPDGESDKASDDKPPAPAPTSVFDDELAGFRSLRDEV